MGDAAEILGVKRKQNSYAMPARKSGKKRVNHHAKLQELLLAAGIDVNLAEPIQRIDKRPAVRWVRKQYSTPLRPLNDISVPIWKVAGEPEKDPKCDPFAEILVQNSPSISYSKDEYKTLPTSIQDNDSWNTSTTEQLFNIVLKIGCIWIVISDRLASLGIDKTAIECRKRYYTVATKILSLRRQASTTHQLHGLEISPYDEDRDNTYESTMEDAWNSVANYTESDYVKLKSDSSRIKTLIQERHSLSLENEAYSGEQLFSQLQICKPQSEWRRPSRYGRVTTRFLRITSLKNERRVETSIGTIELFSSTNSVFNKAVDVHKSLRKYYHLLDLIKKEEQQITKLEKDTKESSIAIDIPSIRRILRDPKMKRKWESD